MKPAAPMRQLFDSFKTYVYFTTYKKYKNKCLF